MRTIMQAKGSKNTSTISNTRISLVMYKALAVYVSVGSEIMYSVRQHKEGHEFSEVILL